jgi:hypothetical protein
MERKSMQEMMLRTERGPYDLDSKRQIDATTYLQMVYRVALGRTHKEYDPWIGLVLHFVKPTVIPFQNPFTGEVTSKDEPEWSTEDVFVLEHDFRRQDDDEQIKIGFPPDPRFEDIKDTFKGFWMDVTIDKLEELFGADARRWLDDFNHMVGIVSDIMRGDDE